jgi:hypothetical protein
MKSFQHAVRLFAAALLLASCARNTNAWTELTPEGAGGPQFHLTGTVTRQDVEGGLWVIRTQDGANYNAINLPREFQVEGVAIEADARRRENVPASQTAGPQIDILRIRKR